MYMRIIHHSLTLIFDYPFSDYMNWISPVFECPETFILLASGRFPDRSIRKHLHCRLSWLARVIAFTEKHWIIVDIQIDRINEDVCSDKSSFETNTEDITRLTKFMRKRNEIYCAIPDSRLAKGSAKNECNKWRSVSMQTKMKLYRRHLSLKCERN